MKNFFKRHIGQILLDAGLLSKQVLKRALSEQGRSKEKLGEVLVRMGAVRAGEVSASLEVQKYLSNMEDAVATAAGERQLLGSLLVESGQIKSAELERAIAEQERTGEKLGTVLVRLGFLSDQQLNGLLNFQSNQAGSSGPLRLGELLVSTGNLSREDLDAALAKQTLTHQKLGEVLVADGYLSNSQVQYGIGLQKMFVHAVLAAIFSFGMAAASHASDVKLAWDPSPDSSIAGYKVYYQADSQAIPFSGSGSVEGAAPVDVQNLNSATISGLDPGHTYYFAVTSYDDTGTESVYSNIISVDTVVPSTAITSPANNATVSGTLTITADALNNTSVAGVRFFVNGVLQGFDTAAPYEFTWNTAGVAPGSYTLTAAAYDADGTVTESSAVQVSVVVPDVVAPTVALTSPVSGAVVAGITTISGTAVDDTAVSRVEIYKDGQLISAGNSAHFSYNWDTKTVANGVHKLMAKAYDSADNVAQSYEVVVSVNNVAPDSIAPVIGSFSMPATAASLTVPISSFAATDDVAVSGFKVTESATPPLASAAGWSATAPASFTFSGAGVKTAYAWTKDAAGNVSAAKTSSVTITIPDITAPTVTSFAMPATAASLTVPVTSFAAADNVAVTGYKVTETATPPSPNATGWSASAPTSFTFSGGGTKTAYAWTKDAAGNVSAAKTSSVTITLSDATAPVVSSFAMPASAASRTVAVTSFAASDNVAVTGYRITESSKRPLASATGWSAAAPTSFTFSGAGTKTAYAWTKDAAGNVSAAKHCSVIITLPDNAAPTVNSFVMPSTSTLLKVPVTSFGASDDIAVTGYLITESATPPAVSASGWSPTAPSAFTFSGAGVKTAYAWTKDASGKVSAAKSAVVTITVKTTKRWL